MRAFSVRLLVLLCLWFFSLPLSAHPGWQSWARQQLPEISDEEIVRVIEAVPTHYATPTLIQYVVTGSSIFPATDPVYTLNAYSSVTQFDVYLPNPALASNCLVIGVQTQATGTSMSVSDDHGNTWTSAGAALVGPNMQQQCFYALGVTAGTTHIIVTFGTPIPKGVAGPAVLTQAIVCEFNNVATTSAADGFHSTTNSSTTAWTAGSFTTGTAGDLVLAFAFSDLVAAYGGKVSLGTALSWTMAACETTNTGVACEYGIQAAAGAINADITWASSNNGGMIAFALKTATAGTGVPSGIYIRGRMCNSETGQGFSYATSPIPVQFASQGNTFVASWDGGGGGTGIAVTDSPNTWTSAGVDTAGNQWLYAGAVTSGLRSMTFTGPTAAGATVLTIYDITGGASSPFDSTAGFVDATGGQTVNSQLNVINITPSTSNGLVFGFVGISNGSVMGIDGAAFLFDATTYPQMDALDHFSENNGIAHVYNSSAAQVNFTFCTGMDFNAGVGNWWASAICIKAASPTAYQTFTPVNFPSVTSGVALTTPGVYTFFVPSNLNGTSVKVECYGSGGAGSRSATASTGRAGGGGGAYANRTALAVTKGNRYTFGIAPGGTDGTAPASATGTATFGDAALCLGASGKSTTANSSTGGAGGTTAASTGDTKNAGGTGGAGGGSSGGGGGGGGSAGSTGAGGIGTAGSAGPTGGGGGAAGTGGGATGGAGASSQAAGSPGNAPGAGGGGAFETSVAQAGGVGASGQIIWTFTLQSGGAPFLLDNTMAGGMYSMGM